MSQRQIAKECGISQPTVPRIARMLKSKPQADILNDVELTAKAIELINKGEVKDPTYFVRLLNITLPEAEELFYKIVEDKQLVDVLEIEQKLVLC